MSLLPPINLPLPITLHASGLGILGLIQTFHSTTSNEPANPMLGIAACGLSLAYFSTAYMPMHDNQFLYATVPVRIVLATLAATRLVVGGRLSEADRRNLLVVALYDGLGAVALGWWLGRFDGRVPGV